MKQKKVEILAPAGSFESLVAAVNAGADAVYIGGSRYGARAYANNLDEEMMLQAIDYVHLHGCRIYMTVNTLMKEEELSQLYDYLKPYYERGLDAVIVQDMGAFARIRADFPDLPIHASTQMTVTGVYGARTLAALGAERVVTARELSLEEIKEIHDSVDVEIESFVHGALCYCYSGQCLFSSIIGGRSGNRGRCAQPCRLPYEVKDGRETLNKKDQKYILSLKDLCTLDLIPDMVEAGIYSMKIEGRMKSPRYTAGVVSIYRKYVDRYLSQGRAGYRVEEKDRKQLLELFDRGGFTEGYYRQHNDKDMSALKERPAFREGNEALFQYLDEAYVNKTAQKAVTGQLYLHPGMASVFTLSCGGMSVCVEGEAAEEAKNQPMDAGRIEKQMNKTGGTPFVFEALEIQIEGNVFIPVQTLNQLRRDGLEALKQALLSPYQRLVQRKEPLQEIHALTEDASGPVSWPPRLNASVETSDQLKAAAGSEFITDIYLDISIHEKEWRRAAELCRSAGKGCYLMLAHIFRAEAREYYIRNKSLLIAAAFDGVVVRSLEEVEFVKEQNWKLPIIFDYTVYQWNRESEALYRQLGAKRLTMPVELNSKELEKSCQGGELMIYGYLPMMVTAQCIRKTTAGCDRTPGLIFLKDRLSKEFPVKNHCKFCYNTIYNTSPLSLHGQEEIVKKLKPSALRLSFTMETAEEAETMIQMFGERFLDGKDTAPVIKEFTRGHFKRGVE